MRGVQLVNHPDQWCRGIRVSAECSGGGASLECMRAPLTSHCNGVLADGSDVVGGQCHYTKLPQLARHLTCSPTPECTTAAQPRAR